MSTADRLQEIKATVTHDPTCGCSIDEWHGEPLRPREARWLVSEFEALTALVPPCDGWCSTECGPEETCSRHGRPPRYLWDELNRVARERDEALAAIKRVRALADAWRARGEHDMAYSKTIPDDVADALLAAGAEMVEAARKVRNALDGTTR